MCVKRGNFGYISPNPMFVKAGFGTGMGSVLELAGGRVKWASARLSQHLSSRPALATRVI